MSEITPAQPPNRYNTPVTVEVYHNNSPTRYMGFSDIQLAYHWVKERISNDRESHLRMLPDVCEKLDYEYGKNGLRGYVVVGYIPTVQYCLYYGKLII